MAVEPTERGPFEPPIASKPPKPPKRGPLRLRPPPPGPKRKLASLAAILIVAAIAVVLLRPDDEPEAVAPALVSPQVASMVRGMDPDEKVDAVMAIGFAGAPASAAIGRTQGGVVIEAVNWPGVAAAPALSRALHAAGGRNAIPPLVIGLQEGGVYRAYPDLPPAESELDVGDSGDLAFAESWSTQTASALKKAGFDINLAPIADVATLDSAISDRAFGDSPDTVAAMTAATIAGCAAAEFACAPAHFPGAGAASADTDEEPASASLDLETFEARDLEPFRSAFAAGAPAVVLSHVFYPAYDSVTPASLSERIATDLLRDELEFEGPAITDDLSAGAISAGRGTPEAAVDALDAGADLLLISDPAHAAAARKALLEAAGSGELERERLNAAVGRVLELKRGVGLLAKK